MRRVICVRVFMFERCVWSSPHRPPSSCPRKRPPPSQRAPPPPAAPRGWRRGCTRRCCSRRPGTCVCVCVSVCVCVCGGGRLMVAVSGAQNPGKPQTAAQQRRERHAAAAAQAPAIQHGAPVVKAPKAVALGDVLFDALRVLRAVRLLLLLFCVVVFCDVISVNAQQRRATQRRPAPRLPPKKQTRTHTPPRSKKNTHNGQKTRPRQGAGAVPGQREHRQLLYRDRARVAPVLGVEPRRVAPAERDGRVRGDGVVR